MSNSNRKPISVGPINLNNDKDTMKLLLDIQQKINNSPALNGGFDTLLYKVDKIEESQGKIVERIEEIHESIYDPDKGLYARISDLKSSQVNDYNQIDKKLTEINTWKVQFDKNSIEEKTSDKELSKKVEEQQKVIESIDRWKTNTSTLVKRASLATIGSIFTIIGKLFYDYVVVHWKLIVVNCLYGDCLYKK